MYQEKIPKVISALVGIVFILIIGLGFLIFEQIKVINMLTEQLESNIQRNAQ